MYTAQFKRDVINLKNEIEQDTPKFVRNLIDSLTRKTFIKFSSYKIDLSLSMLKIFYEMIYPETRHGAKLNLKKLNQESKVDLWKRMVTSPFLGKIMGNNIYFLTRIVVQNLFAYYDYKKCIPPFVDLLHSLTGLSKTLIKTRIQIGRFYLMYGFYDQRFIQYRNGRLPYTVIYKALLKINKEPVRIHKL